ncbi:MAG: helix-turn-helix transcriptional regulator [Candidatus Ratteibacteria bacterium]|jgi:transcriptional regulator with XRE-family HTH domain
MPRGIELKFAGRLRELRAKYGYTQQRLSEIARVDYKHIQRLESKEPPVIRINTAEKIAKAFNISISELLDFN